jgi:predicted DNA-binding antitoxin AbrB/MazE fold protein
VTETVEAVYEKGLFKPVRKPNLPDGARVMLKIERIEGLAEVVRRISEEYAEVEEDPLERLLSERR